MLFLVFNSDMKLYAIRHTKVDVEPGICYGQSDVDLAASFQTEKAEVIKSIAGNTFDKVWSSPLQRCKKLADEIFPDDQIIQDKRLMELDFGDWELRSWDEIYSTEEGKRWMDNYQHLPTLNGESYPEMKQRVESFLIDLRRMEYKQVAVVTHAGVIRLLKHFVEGVEIDKVFAEFNPAYGSVSIFEI